MVKKIPFLLCLGLGAAAFMASPAFAASYDVRIANGNDDVEEFVYDHHMYITSSDLEMPYEDTYTPNEEQVIGLRWAVPVSKGATVTKAYVEFTFDEPEVTGVVHLIIEGQLAPDAPAFTAATADVSSRTRTKAQVKWAPEEWAVNGATAHNASVELKYKTPDLSPIIQEIVNQPGWAGGNALVIIISDDKSNPSKATRAAAAYEDQASNGFHADTPALLHIEALQPAANTPSPKDGTVGVVFPLFSWSKGDSALLHNVYLGKTPDLTQANLVSPNLPVTMYYHVAGLEPGATYYWRVDEVDVAGKVTTGPVWSFIAQAETAYYPTPPDGAVDVAPKPVLSWYVGLGAAKHHVYFGTSLDDVTKGAAGTDKGELTAATFAPGALDSVTTYYWRVDELGLGNAVKTGPVWSFTTYLPVDDFESYTDKAGQEIFATWVDGFTNGTNGSTVGYLTATNGTFGETQIVHSGKQSMPMDYNNVKSPFYSEAERTFAPVQDWTAGGLANLVLDFRGVGTNGAGALYVAVEDSSGKIAVATNPDPAAVTLSTWMEWKIPLSSLTGVNLAKVKNLYIGVGDRNNPTKGGAGRIYIDDIRVTKP
jgi:hypothetical protein